MAQTFKVLAFLGIKKGKKMNFCSFFKDLKPKRIAFTLGQNKFYHFQLLNYSFHTSLNEETPTQAYTAISQR